MMIPPPEPIRLRPGQQVSVAFGRPWKDAVISLMEPGCGYTPWQYDEDRQEGDVLISVLDTQPQVFGCIEIIGPKTDDSPFSIDQKWILRRLPTVPDWLSLPDVHKPLGFEQAQNLLSILDSERQTYSQGFGIEPPTTAEAARVILDSGGRCTHCDKQINLNRPDARGRIHTHLAEANSFVGDHYSDWPAALCTPCYGKMSTGGFINYLDFRFAGNPQCPRCRARRTAEYIRSYYIEDLPADPSPWKFYNEEHRGPDDYGRWLCHRCHFVFSDVVQ